ncbi:hypothetical protein AD998_14560 [bacterium 336/3]|nr:hypothetical protein AD998_14560 [bacterium 336/3]
MANKKIPLTSKVRGIEFFKIKYFMLRIFIICVISILGITSKAQNTEKFIEVYVQDEAVIEPDEIEYAIYAFPSETIYFDEDASGRTITMGADSKKNLLRKYMKK